MQQLDPLFAPLAALPTVNRLCRFLLIFSRFEFALKSLHYVRQQGDRLIVEWRRFAHETAGTFRLNDELEQSIRILLTAPPARQILRDDRLDWEEEHPVEPSAVTLEWLLDMVYRVRNNLFHGGKWPPDPARDPELLEASEAVIAECLRLREDIRIHYGAV